MQTDKVKHRSKPSEPFAQPGAHGRITRTREDGPLRITPASRGIPAQAYVHWGDEDGGYHTWEALSDLIVVGKR
jgi:hypothetical protein